MSTKGTLSLVKIGTWPRWETGWHYYEECVTQERRLTLVFFGWEWDMHIAGGSDGFTAD